MEGRPEVGRVNDKGQAASAPVCGAFPEYRQEVHGLPRSFCGGPAACAHTQTMSGTFLHCIQGQYLWNGKPWDDLLLGMPQGAMCRARERVKALCRLTSRSQAPVAGLRDMLQVAGQSCCTGHGWCRT